jgi:dolichol kinase
MSETPPPSLGPERPQNLKRSAFHAFWGLFAVYLAERYLRPIDLTIVSGSFTLFSWTVEGIKRLGPRGAALYDKLFGAITHTHERHKVNSATWYCTAVFISTLCFEPRAITLSVLCLAIGDPIAGLVGRRFGRIRLIGRRTLEGTLAFVLSASLAAFVLLQVAHPTVANAPLVSLCAGSAAALGELMSGPWLDDNLTIPLASAAAVTLALA